MHRRCAEIPVGDRVVCIVTDWRIVTEQQRRCENTFEFSGSEVAAIPSKNDTVIPVLSLGREKANR